MQMQFLRQLGNNRTEARAKEEMQPAVQFCKPLQEKEWALPPYPSTVYLFFLDTSARIGLGWLVGAYCSSYYSFF